MEKKKKVLRDLARALEMEVNEWIQMTSSIIKLFTLGVFVLGEKGFRKSFYALLCVFGNLKKIGQTEISFRVDHKITLFWRKIISAFILPSNQLHYSHSLEAPHRHSKLKKDRAPQSKTRQMMSLHRPSSSPTTHTPPTHTPSIHPQWVSFTVWTKNVRQPHHFNPIHRKISPIHPLFHSNPPSISV